MTDNSSDQSALPPVQSLQGHHVEGARLYANREHMVRGLGLPRGGIIAEVGVAFGDFSKFLIDALAPQKFVAFDLWTMHEYPMIWGRPSAEAFQNKTQLDYFKNRFASKGSVVVTESGLSYEALDKYPDGFFDLIYIDAGHDYYSVKMDAEVSARKLKYDGTIIFNDYIMYDHIAGGRFGVVHAVNEMIIDSNWRVTGFALQSAMFCDIAITRM